MRCIAHQKHAARTPIRGDAMMNPVKHGVEYFELVDRPDEFEDFFLELLLAWLGNVRGERKQKSPAMRLPDQDHPFFGIGEIGEIRIVARVFDIEIDPHVDQKISDRQRFSLDLDVEQGPDRASPAVAGEKIGSFHRSVALGRLENGRDTLVAFLKALQAMLEMHAARRTRHRSPCAGSAPDDAAAG